jgi:hypothetical protein
VVERVSSPQLHQFQREADRREASLGTLKYQAAFQSNGKRPCRLFKIINGIDMNFLYFPQRGNSLRILRVELLELPTTAHNNPLQKRIFKLLMVGLLTLHADRSRVTLKPARSSPYLPGRPVILRCAQDQALWRADPSLRSG